MRQSASDNDKVSCKQVKKSQHTDSYSDCVATIINTSISFGSQVGLVWCRLYSANHVPALPATHTSRENGTASCMSRIHGADATMAGITPCAWYGLLTHTGERGRFDMRRLCENASQHAFAMPAADFFVTRGLGKLMLPPLYLITDEAARWRSWRRRLELEVEMEVSEPSGTCSRTRQRWE